LVLYRLRELKANESVAICAGEKDADALAALGIPSTTNPLGEGKWRDAYTQQLVDAGITRVRIFPDNDDTGRAHADQVARSCLAAGISDVKVITLPDVPPKGDVSNYLEQHSKAELLVLARDAPAYTPPTQTTPSKPVPPGAVLVNMADVQPEAISWLWTGRLARGKVTALAGDPGMGKSFITLDIAARISTARQWPDGEAISTPGDAVFLAAEDGLADTMRPRLDAMQADVSRIHVLQAIRVANDGGERPFCLQTDIAHLEDSITKTGAVLVVIDPISSYMGNVNTYNDAEVRTVLMPLVTLAARTNVAVLVLMHLTKDTKAKASQRAMASMAFVAVPRIVLAVGPDPDEPNPFAPGATRALGSLKPNICEPAPTWAYRTANNRLEWIEPRDDIRVDALLAGTVHHDVDARQDVEAFLCRVLADGSYQRSDAIEAAAKDAGITKDRLYKTRKRLCEGRRVGGFGPGAHWECRLKPEFVSPPAFADHSASIVGGPPLAANNGSVEPLTPIESTPSSLLAAVANNGAPANNGGEEWGEV
jgi:putative DNA primase/helicase